MHIDAPRMRGSAVALARPELEAIAVEVRDRARAAAPSATGRLQRGIDLDPSDLTRVVSTAPYSTMVEWGTSDTAPQPFIGPAIEAVARER